MKQAHRGRMNKNVPAKKNSKNIHTDMEQRILLQLKENREISKALSKLLEQFSIKNESNK